MTQIIFAGVNLNKKYFGQNFFLYSDFCCDQNKTSSSFFGQKYKKFKIKAVISEKMYFLAHFRKFCG